MHECEATSNLTWEVLGVEPHGVLVEDDGHGARQHGIQQVSSAHGAHVLHRVLGAHPQVWGGKGGRGGARGEDGRRQRRERERQSQHKDVCSQMQKDGKVVAVNAQRSSSCGM